MSIHPSLNMMALLVLACSLVPAYEKEVAAEATLEPTAPVRVQPLSKELVAAFELIPVQQGGRVKPLSTFAAFTLLKINGKRNVRLHLDDNGMPVDKSAGGVKQKLNPTEWLLDCLFYPQQARHYPVLVLDNDAVIDVIKLKLPNKGRRDRYSYHEIEPARDELLELARNYSKIEADERSNVESQLVNFADAWFTVHRLLRVGDFTRQRYPVSDFPILARIVPDKELISISALLRNSDAFRTVGREVLNNRGSDDEKQLQEVIVRLEQATALSQPLVFLPPLPGVKEDDWLPLMNFCGNLLSGSEGSDKADAHLNALLLWERCSEFVDKPGEFTGVAVELQQQLAGLATAVGKYDKIPMEVSYYEWDFFYKALMFFALATVLVLFVWIFPDTPWLSGLTSALVWLGVILITIGVVYRCILKGRPPVTNLYETILFIGGTGVIMLMVSEWLTKLRLGLSVAAAFGFVAMVLAMRYEATDAEDTMAPLVAVLDTNFWLATHVPIINLGYAAGMAAGFVGHCYIIGRLFTSGADERFKALGRIAYGILAFGLITSLVGTILGGIWANDSWGRFWGWDPKENGALMICISQIIILHARLAGWIRDFGVCFWASAANTVVAFSWWHVNLLGVGLHSYGFTAGLKMAVFGFYAIEAFVLVLGVIAWLLHRKRTRRQELVKESEELVA